MAYIEIIQPEQSEGELKDIYENIKNTRGKIAEVHKIHSLNPNILKNHIDLYMNLMYGNSPLKRYQREMIGVVVSSANDCSYCQTHHADALNYYWQDNKKTEEFRNDFKSIKLLKPDRLLCDFSWNLTKDPNNENNKNEIDLLKENGFNERAILDATTIVAYFNFVNRIVLGLGISLENDNVEGYKYEFSTSNNSQE